MSRISGAMRELQRVDALAARDQWVNGLHPLVKLCVTVFYIVLLVSFPKYDLAGVICFMAYPAAMFILSENSVMGAVRRLKAVLLLVCLVGIANPFLDRVEVLRIGTVTVTGGVISMVTLMCKGVFAVLASYLLIVTTGIEKLCCALRLLHLPKSFVTQILLSYRYVGLLMGEAERMQQAYALRAPRQRGIHIRAWGSLTGLLLLRSMDRAETVYESMCLRGYQGEFPMENRVAWRRADVVYLTGWILGLLLIRFGLPGA